MLGSLGLTGIEIFCMFDRFVKICPEKGNKKGKKKKYYSHVFKTLKTWL